jgi:hypothetical protein
MGVGIGIGLSRVRSAPTQSEGNQFINAATAAGYSGGSAICADVTFNALIAIPALGYAQAVSYFELADAASYTDGSVFCAEQSFQSLIDIA